MRFIVPSDSAIIGNMPDEKFNLFLYGSLRDPSIFKSVCGLSFTLRHSHVCEDTLFAELAILPGFRRVSPDNVYFYAVAESNAKIEGFVVNNLSAEAMADLDRYEGKYYGRETVQVNTATGLVEAQAYLVSTRKMQKKFGDRFHVNLMNELWLRKRIEKFFDKHTRPGEKSLDASIERRARRELLGTTERDLIISHLGSDVVSDYYLEHELDRPIPSIKHLIDDADAQPYIGNYLALMVKHVLLNQFERHIYERYRFELERLGTSQRFFTRSTSLLIALRMINANRSAVDLLLGRCLETMPPGLDFDLIDYVKYAVSAADSIFDNRLVRAELERVRVNRQPGLVPLGIELELSNLGARATDKKMKAGDRDFDGFRYFHDFCLDILTWKLGGYIDDHSGESYPNRRGFFELAPGRLNVLGEISKPAAADPWILNQLICEITDFYPIEPHSLHLSMQLRKRQRSKPKTLPLSFVKCLLALGGGTRQRTKGRLWVSRLSQAEIEQDIYGPELVFARRSKRLSRMSADDGIGPKTTPNAVAYVQQYKFIRLERRANYEPLIMALKGLQIAYNPGDYLTAAQLAHSRRLSIQYQQLKEWSADPTEISHSTRGRFLAAIKKGLMDEAHHRPAHKLHYIDWALGAIDVQLRLFNKEINRYRSPAKQEKRTV